MYTIERIKEEFTNVCAEQGVVVSTPIEINARLKSTLGRVKYVYNGKGGVTPTKVEFNREFIESATEECVHQTILHEAAHYIVGIKNPTERHGHDKVFREMCATLGCTRDRASGKVEYTEAGLQKVRSEYKYELRCKDCGAIVGRYKTKCKAVKFYNDYYCGACRGDLELIIL